MPQQNEPALFTLVRTGSLQTVRAYLSKYPKHERLPIQRDQTALHVAVEACFNTAHEFLQNDEADDEENRAYEARVQGLLCKMSALIENDPTALEHTNYRGETVVHMAAKGCDCRAAHRATEARVNLAVMQRLAGEERPSLWIRDDNDNTALHTAILCGNSRPAAWLLKQMHKVTTDGGVPPTYRKYDLLDEKNLDEYGPLPLLQHALRNNASRKFVKLILKTFPEAGRVGFEGKLPLVSSLENTISSRKLELILGSYPEALKIPSGDGDLPLHLAAMYYHDNGEQLPVLQLLVDSYPQALTTANVHGQWPLHCAMECEDTAQAGVLELPVVQALSNHNVAENRQWSTVRNTSSSSEVNNSQSSIESDVFGVPGLILSADSNETSAYETQVAQAGLEENENESECRPKELYHSDCYGDLPLHLACRRVSKITVEVVQWLLECNPFAVAAKNDYGHLPLHLAAAEAASGSKSEATVKIIQLLIKAYPNALWQPDDEGDVPLQCAVSNNAVAPEIVRCFLEQQDLSWKQLSDKNDHLKSDLEGYPYRTRRLYPSTNLQTRQTPLHFACVNGVSAAVIDLLIDHAPEAASQYDVFGHLPFHTALTSSFPNTDNNVSILRKLLYLSQQEHKVESSSFPVGEVKFSRATLPCTATGIPALFAACEQYRQSDSCTDSEDEECTSLDILRFLIERSPEIFAHRGS